VAVVVNNRFFLFITPPLLSVSSLFCFCFGLAGAGVVVVVVVAGAVASALIDYPGTIVMVTFLFLIMLMRSSFIVPQ